MSAPEQQPDKAGFGINPMVEGTSENLASADPLQKLPPEELEIVDKDVDSIFPQPVATDVRERLRLQLSALVIARFEAGERLTLHGCGPRWWREPFLLSSVHRLSEDALAKARVPDRDRVVALASDSNDALALVGSLYDRYFQAIYEGAAKFHDVGRLIIGQKGRYKAVALGLFGRRGSDAAWNFALAGARDAQLFANLAEMQAAELRRMGCPQCESGRKRQRTLVFQVCNRMMAAGLPTGHDVFIAAAELLRADGAVKEAEAIERLSFGDLRPLGWLGRFAMREPKINAPTLATSKAALEAVQFSDPMRPLTVDIGCGFGTSLLGIEGNVLGCDSSPLKVAYASGIAERWGRAGDASFVVANAHAMVDWLSETFFGRVSCVLIQFPTPFALQHGSYLPDLKRYMIDGELLSRVRVILDTAGTLLFQTNAEDVAIHFLALAKSVGFEADEEHGSATDPSDIECLERFCPSLKYERTLEGSEPVRVQRYLAAGGEGAPRAVGPCWMQSLHVPRSETEALVELDGKRVFRARFRPRPL